MYVYILSLEYFLYILTYFLSIFTLFDLDVHVHVKVI